VCIEITHLERHLTAVAITHASYHADLDLITIPTTCIYTFLFLRLGLWKSVAFAGPLDRAAVVILPAIRKLLIWVTINCFLSAINIWPSQQKGATAAATEVLTPR